MNIVLVCGSREADWNDTIRIRRALDGFHATYLYDLVITGGSRGVDGAALEWAKENGIQTAEFPIPKKRWDKVGKAAGPIRNRMMLRIKPDHVIAFPGGQGTADMTAAALQAGIHVERVVW
jgi:predicted Rossmann-fold nucleotide-binding protein